jgi:hypothetical protein
MVRTMSSISGSALSGINSGLANLAQDAQVIAQSVTTSGDTDSMTNALVDSLQQQLGIEASAKVLSAENQTVGTLIDVFA